MPSSSCRCPIRRPIRPLRPPRYAATLRSPAAPIPPESAAPRQVHAVSADRTCTNVTHKLTVVVLSLVKTPRESYTFRNERNSVPEVPSRSDRRPKCLVRKETVLSLVRLECGSRQPGRQESEGARGLFYRNRDLPRRNRRVRRSLTKPAFWKLCGFRIHIGGVSARLVDQIEISEQGANRPGVC